MRVDVRSPRGEVLAAVPADPDFDPVQRGVDRTAYPVLGHLDPHGDTILNRMQARTLKEEIVRCRAECSLIPAPFAATLLDLCEQALARPHRFLWFIGD